MFKNDDVTMFTSNRKSIFKALILVALIFCCVMLPACAKGSNKNEATDADKDSGDKASTNEWVEVENEDEYSELIDGDTDFENLRRTFLYLNEPINSDEIKKSFGDSGGFLIVMIYGNPDTTIDDVPYDQIHYVYGIEEINKTICGITKFKFEKNKTYYDEDGYKSYTDDANYHNILIRTGHIPTRNIVLKNGRYNDKILEINFEDRDMGSVDPEAEPLSIKPCRAIFKKNKNGKFTLDSIKATEDE
ncbi:MAG: hypothetical protein PUK14_05345 [Clostridiales bacterium]|nr:hypothetical protein [Clostridiales bacterium]MDY6117217.1 hypothetical protein [Anaerovoracaceae bacterium]